MIKTLGSLIIFFVFTVAGVMAGSRLSNRVKYLKTVSDGLEFVRKEMLYHNTTIANIVLKINKNNYFKEIGIFERLYQYLLNGHSIDQGWWEAVKQSKLKSILNEREMTDIIRIGDWLGKSYVNNQISNIDSTLSELSYDIKLARDDKEKYYKICNSLGALIGLFIVILLW